MRPKLLLLALGVVAAGGCASTSPYLTRISVTARRDSVQSKRDREASDDGSVAKSSDIQLSVQSLDSEADETGSFQFASAMEPKDEISSDAPLPLVHDLLPDATWTLDELEAVALENNPAIRQASASAHKAMGYHEQVGLKPNPTIGYGGSQIADRQTDQHTVFVEQNFILGKKLSRNRDVLSHEIQSQEWEVEAQRQRVLTDVRQRFYEALAAQKRLKLATDFREIAAKGVQMAELRIEAKEGAQPEKLQVEIQLNQVEVLQRQSEAAYRGAWNQLMAVAGLGGTNPGVLEGDLPESAEITDPQAIQAAALSGSPELQAARARVDRARANIDRQNVQAIPNVSVLFASGVDYATRSGMINAQVGLPVPIFNKNQGNIDAAVAELSRACEELRRIELAIESRMARATQEFQVATVAVEQYRSAILPKAEKTLRLTEEAYQAGQFGFLEMYIARRTYFDTNLEYVAAQVNLAAAQAYLQGMALSGGLDGTRDSELGSGLRDQALNGQ